MVAGGDQLAKKILVFVCHVRRTRERERWGDRSLGEREEKGKSKESPRREGWKGRTGSEKTAKGGGLEGSGKLDATVARHA